MLEVNRSTLAHGDSFEACPDCQYDGGWHVVLYRHRRSKGEHDVKMMLRCPKCHVTYDLDLHCCLEHTGLTTG